MANIFQDHFTLQNSDGTPLEPEAMYFILRLDTDPYARIALAGYAASFDFDDPEFADKIRDFISQAQTGSFKNARGVLPYKEGDEKPEDAIRRLRG